MQRQDFVSCINAAKAWVKDSENCSVQMFSNQYFEDREDKIIIFREKLWYLSRTNMPLLRQ